MISLNLISPDKKQQFRLEQIYIVIKNLIILLLLVSIVIAIALLFTKAALQNHFSQIVEETTLTTQYANTFGTEVREFNKIIVAVDNVQEDYVDWVSFLEKTSKLVSGNVFLKTMTISENKIVIKGFASTREDLLKLKENFENAEIFNNVEMPLEDLLKRNNIEFDIKATIVFENI